MSGKLLRVELEVSYSLPAVWIEPHRADPDEVVDGTRAQALGAVTAVAGVDPTIDADVWAEEPPPDTDLLHLRQQVRDPPALTRLGRWWYGFSRTIFRRCGAGWHLQGEHHLCERDPTMNTNNTTATATATAGEESKVRPRHGRGLRRVAAMLCLGMALTAVTGLAAPGSPVDEVAQTVGLETETADATTVRLGDRWNQVDMLLNGYETNKAATSYRHATWYCWGAIAAAYAASWAAGIYAQASCTSLVTVCAARAKAVGRWAGITFYPGGGFCWTY